MNKYKVCVYAICKNEAKHVKRWLKSVQDADYICVLDTGSIDNTLELFEGSKAIVKQKEIIPWRFDIARNESLKLIPKDTDICICLDLDEILLPGWRKYLEQDWKENTTRMQYVYNWKLDKNNVPIISFHGEKIHSLKNYYWENPVHEILKYNNKTENIVFSEKIIINHYPDSKKSRSSYLPLLELSVKENPENDRNVHYLGREYMYYKKWNKSIDMLIKHLNLKSATWKDERCASMRYISKCYINLKRYDEAEMWLKKAINESPYLREPYFELGYLYYILNEFYLSKIYLLKCLKIKEKSKSYLNEFFCWDGTVEDILSVCEFNLGYYKASLKYAKKALKLKPNDERIKENIEKIKKYL